MHKLTFVVLLSCCILFGLAGRAGAVSQSGVQIAPLRDFQTIKPGQTKTASLTVTNLSSQPETVNLSLKTFSVADYTYNYEFSAPKSDWIHFSQTMVTLEPGENRQITYSISPGKDASPGGYYYTLIASTTIGNANSSSTVQAATLLYLTVDGKLNRAGEINNIHAQRLIFGNTITYSVDVRNSGNVHYFVSTSSKLYGIFASGDTSPTSHLIMPGTVKQVDGAIHSPLLPGLYRVAMTFGSDGGINYTTSRFVFYLPPWTIALALGALLVYRGTRGPKKPNKSKLKSAKKISS